MTTFPIVLVGGPPWGFRVEGGTDCETSLRISTVTEGSKALHQGLKVGDLIERINGEPTAELTNSRARHLIRQADSTLVLFLQREKSSSFDAPEINISSSPTPHRPPPDHRVSGDTERPSSAAPLGLQPPSRHHGSSNVNARGAGLDASDADLGSRSEEDQSGGSTSDSQNSVVNMASSSSSTVKTRTTTWSPLGNTEARNTRGSTSDMGYKSVHFRPGQNGQSSQNGPTARNGLADPPSSSQTYSKISRESNVTSSGWGLNQQRPEGRSLSGDNVHSMQLETKPQSATPWRPSPAPKPQLSSNSFVQSQNTSGFPTLQHPPKPSNWSSNGGNADEYKSLPHQFKPSASQSSRSATWDTVNEPPPFSPGQPRVSSTWGTSSSSASSNYPSARVEEHTYTATTRPRPIQASLDPTRRRPSPPPAVPKLKSVTRNEEDEKLQNEDWWRSFLKDTEQPLPVRQGGPLPAFLPPNHSTLMTSSHSGSERNSSMTELSNTAAVLKLSSSLRNLPEAKYSTVGRPPQKNEVLQEWKSGLYEETNPSGRRSVDLYRQLNENFQHSSPKPTITTDTTETFRNEDLNRIKQQFNSHPPRMNQPIKPANQAFKHESTMPPNLARQPPPVITTMSRKEVTRTEEISRPIRFENADRREPMRDEVTTRREPIRLQPDSVVEDAKDGKEGKDGGKGGKRVIYQGVGPTDEVTGILMATGNSIEEKSRKDWYRKMYASIHKTEEQQLAEMKNKKENPLLANDTSDPSLSPSSTDKDFSDLYGPHARYGAHKYKNQPMKIEDYKPGKHSSIALQQGRRSLHGGNSYAESDSEMGYSSRLNRAPSPTHSDMGDVMRRHKMDAARGKGSRYSMSNFDGRTSRQRYDEENSRRKMEIEQVMEQERQRRFLNEQKENEARRHADTLTPMQKSSLLLNRFEDDIGPAPPDNLQRPEHKVQTRVRGKAKALYTFRAQKTNELSFKRGDTIYLLKQIDKNWFKGEHYGIQGIFPVTYVQVLVSLDDARAMATQKEGQATVKYNFNAQTRAELSLKKGDTVMLIRRVDKNWYEGRLGNRQGIFPVTYVEPHREPETPMMTPMSSHAPTPMPGTPAGRLSPASSIVSIVGPEVPSSPMSPWETDYYDSEVESRGSRTPVNSNELSPRSSQYGRSMSTPKISTNRLQLPIPNTQRRLSPSRSESSTRLYPSTSPSTAMMSNVARDTKQDKGLDRDQKDLYTMTRNRMPESSLDAFVMSLDRTQAHGGSRDRTSRDGSMTSLDRSVTPRVMTSSRPITPCSMTQRDAAQRVDWSRESLVMPRARPMTPMESRLGPVSSLPPQTHRTTSRNQSSAIRYKEDPRSMTLPPPARSVLAADSSAIGPYSFIIETVTTPTRELEMGVSKNGGYQARGSTRDRVRDSSVTPTPEQFRVRSEGKPTPPDQYIARPVADQFSKANLSADGYPRYQVEFAYVPKNADELCLTPGDVVCVMERCDDGWYVGYDEKTNKFGAFPGNFVKLIF